MQSLFLSYKLVVLNAHRDVSLEFWLSCRILNANDEIGDYDACHLKSEEVNSLIRTTQQNVLKEVFVLTLANRE